MSRLPAPFGPFEPTRRLGAGGMAETFEAVRRGPGTFEQRVCIKRILPAFESDLEFVAAFLRKATTSAQLRHTNIVQVLDIGLADGSHYLALELIDGIDLRDLSARVGALSADLVTLIAIDVAAALQHAHAGDGTRPSVVHRDISPSNVLVSRAGEVKLVDFGIAKALGGNRLTATGVIKGKVPYLPPEYIEHAVFDPRSDLFSLGVMLYELACGATTVRRRDRLRHDSPHRGRSACSPGCPLSRGPRIARHVHRAPDRAGPSAPFRERLGSPRSFAGDLRAFCPATAVRTTVGTTAQPYANSQRPAGSGAPSPQGQSGLGESGPGGPRRPDAHDRDTARGRGQAGGAQPSCRSSPRSGHAVPRPDRSGRLDRTVAMAAQERSGRGATVASEASPRSQTSREPGSHDGNHAAGSAAAAFNCARDRRRRSRARVRAGAAQSHPLGGATRGGRALRRCVDRWAPHGPRSDRHPTLTREP